MIDLELVLRFLNLLFIPVLFYIVRIEKRISVIETKCEMFLNGKEGK